MSSTGDIFDTRKLRKLIELMNEHDLGEVDLRDGGVRVRLRKRQDQLVTSVEPRHVTHAHAPAAAPPSAAAPAAASDENMKVIKSPMIGTFFSAPSPDQPSFVKVGDHIGPETTVCVIEAMKVFNEIPAEMSGQIVAVLVENGAAVEFGQPLFKIQ